MDDRPHEVGTGRTTGPAGAPAGRSTSNGKPRTVSEIERDIETTRERLASTIDELGYRVKPATIAKRSVDKAKSVVVDDAGNPRFEKIAMIGGALAAVVGLVVWRRQS